MASPHQNSEFVRENGVVIETYVDGDGPAFVILPSYGRDGGEDFDHITAQLVKAGWKVLRPQPRGIAGSKGPMTGLTMHDLADDVARVVRQLDRGQAVVLGHAFGHMVASVLATDHPDLVKAVVYATAQGSHVPEDIATSPFKAGDLSLPDTERLAILQKAFFAPGHDATAWLKGWYPGTLQMQRAAAKATDLDKFNACGGVPLLELIAACDPFNSKKDWPLLLEQLGPRVTPLVIDDASHALFPEQPDKVADAVVSWAARWQGWLGK